eukprot:128962_1
MATSEEDVTSDPSDYSDMDTPYESSSLSPNITSDDSDNESKPIQIRYPKPEPLNILNKPLQRSKKRKIKTMDPSAFYSQFNNIFGPSTSNIVTCNILPLKPSPPYPNTNSSNNESKKHIHIKQDHSDSSNFDSSSGESESWSPSSYSADGSDSDYVQPSLTNHNYNPHHSNHALDPNKTAFKCTECLFQTDSGAVFKAHSLKAHHITDPFICSKCGKTFVTKGNLTTHTRRIHDKEINYHCDWCDKGFFERSQYRLHCARVHGKTVQIKPEISKKELVEYEQQKPRSNTSGGRFKCKRCGKRFAKKFYLENHVINMHMDNRDKPYQCRYCTYGAAKKWQVMCHENAHRNERAYKCELCERAFNNKKGLKNHKNNIHKRPFKCKDCGRGFGTKAYLQGHVISKHTKEEDKPFQCRYCDHGTHSLRNIRKHEMTHCKDKPYKCKECGKAFKGERSLEIHCKTIHVAEEDKEHECNVCQKRFALKSRLKTHILSHSTDKQFKC